MLGRRKEAHDEPRYLKGLQSGPNIPQHLLLENPIMSNGLPKYFDSKVFLVEPYDIEIITNYFEEGIRLSNGQDGLNFSQYSKGLPAHINATLPLQAGVNEFVFDELLVNSQFTDRELLDHFGIDKVRDLWCATMIDHLYWPNLRDLNWIGFPVLYRYAFGLDQVSNEDFLHLDSSGIVEQLRMCLGYELGTKFLIGPVEGKDTFFDPANPGVTPGRTIQDEHGCHLASYLQVPGLQMALFRGQTTAHKRPEIKQDHVSPIDRKRHLYTPTWDYRLEFAAMTAYVRETNQMGVELDVDDFKEKIIDVREDFLQRYGDRGKLPGPNLSDAAEYQKNSFDEDWYL